VPPGPQPQFQGEIGEQQYAQRLDRACTTVQAQLAQPALGDGGWVHPNCIVKQERARVAELGAHDARQDEDAVAATYPRGLGVACQLAQLFQARRAKQVLQKAQLLARAQGALDCLVSQRERATGADFSRTSCRQFRACCPLRVSSGVFCFCAVLARAVRAPRRTFFAHAHRCRSSHVDSTRPR
jgi:hypothetical protein